MKKHKNMFQTKEEDKASEKDLSKTKESDLPDKSSK